MKLGRWNLVRAHQGDKFKHCVCSYPHPPDVRRGVVFYNEDKVDIFRLSLIFYIIMWKQWVNGVLGIWIVLLPYLGFTSDIHTWLMVVTGIVIAVLAFWSASESKSVAM